MDSELRTDSTSWESLVRAQYRPSPIEIRPAAQAMMISIGSLISIPALVADAGGAGIGAAG
jgi:hypothetical protein